MGEKYKAYKKTFKYKVQCRMEKDGWTVFPICNSKLPIDLLCRKIGYGGKEEMVGVRVKAHGHIYKQERDVLVALGKTLHIGILYAHETNSKEPAFNVLFWQKYSRCSYLRR